MRICSICSLEKPLSDYPVGKNKGKPYLYSYCRICFNQKSLAKSRRYKERNREKLSAYSREYYQNNTSQCKLYFKRYYQEHASEIKEAAKNHVYNKRKADASFRVKESVSSRIFQALRGRKLGAPTFNHLGYSIDALKTHLESLFEPWMSWNNWGRYNVNTWKDDDSSTWTWQIDHIIPHSKFQYSSMADSSFKECWSLANLRPLSSKENLSKGDK